MALVRCNLSSGRVKLPDTFMATIIIDGSAQGNSVILNVWASGTGTINIGDDTYNYMVSPTTSFSKSGSGRITAEGKVTVTFTKVN